MRRRTGGAGDGCAALSLSRAPAPRDDGRENKKKGPTRQSTPTPTPPKHHQAPPGALSKRQATCEEEDDRVPRGAGLEPVVDERAEEGGRATAGTAGEEEKRRGAKQELDLFSV